MRYSLLELSDVIRSKNAGPYELTFDIILKSEEIFENICQQNVFTKEIIADLYDIEVSDVINIVEFKEANAIKITIIRPISSGALRESDVYGAQQHGPLMNFSFELV